MAPPKTFPAYSGPASPVVTSLSHWSDASMLTPHEPIRDDLGRMERVLQPQFFDGTQEWKVKAFFRWYNTWFYPGVHHHHDVEEAIFFPTIATRCESIPERMSADHSGLLQMLDDIRTMEPRFKKKASEKELRSAAEELRQKVTHLRQEMLEHLNEEERFFTPVVRESFTEKEHSQIVDRIVRAGGLKNAKMLPWAIHAMYRWAGRDFVEKDFRKEIPAPIRFFLDRFWYPKYVKQGVGGLEMLELERDPKTGGKKSVQLKSTILSPDGPPTADVWTHASLGVFI